MMYELHRLANLFPLMEGEEFDQLVADIKVNGLHEPIMLCENQILDGRDRYRACLKAGVSPKFAQFRDIPPPTISPTSYVISRNINRRHLTTQQRVAIAAELATRKVGDNQHTLFEVPPEPAQNYAPSVDQLAAAAPVMSTEQAAKAMKVSRRSVVAAKQRMRIDPAAHQKAKVGMLERKKPRTSSPKNAGSDEKSPAKQPDLVATIRNLNVAWPLSAIARAVAEMDEGQRSELRQHLPDLAQKLQQLAEMVKSAGDAPGLLTGAGANG
jgi:hypothetical protein